MQKLVTYLSSYSQPYISCRHQYIIQQYHMEKDYDDLCFETKVFQASNFSFMYFMNCRKSNVTLTYSNKTLDIWKNLYLCSHHNLSVFAGD